MMKTKSMMMLSWSLLLILPFLLLPAHGMSEEHPEVPESLPGVVIIGAEQLLAMVESGQSLIIDSRKPSDFKIGSVPGAINCPVTSGNHSLDKDEVAQTATDIKNCSDGIITADRAKTVATFCNGLRCWRSPKLAIALKHLGFVHVHWYRLGMNDWKSKGLPME